MNYSMILYLLGYVLRIEGGFLLLPVITAAIYCEKEGIVYLICACVLMFLGTLLTIKKPKNSTYFSREGLVTVALSWIAMSVFGAMPIYFSGDVNSYTSALFEIVSGFTTTGASNIADLDALSHTTILWRSLSHWIGGMGVLVFMLAIIPLTGGQSMFLMRTESPGPVIGKLVPKIRTTAKILYEIYFVMTVIQFVLLVISGMPVFDSINISMATAGTGGFSISNAGFSSYSVTSQAIVTIFMFLFGVNFNVYYLYLAKRPKEAIKNEEVFWYFVLALMSILLITVNIKGEGLYDDWFHAFHNAAFQVSSIMTTTGFTTCDFNKWPDFSKVILVCLMFTGGCAGSTCGGIKISRIVVMTKSVGKELMQLIHPRSVKVLTLNDVKVEHETIRQINVFIMSYILIFTASILLISFDDFGFTTNFTAIAATINNVGPGLGMVGPSGNFSQFSDMSKYVMIFDMLAGRLELFPLLVLFVPATWKK